VANFAITIELRGQIKVLEALTAVSKNAAFAQRTALRAAGRKGRSEIARTFASRYAVPLKLFRKRVRFFNARRASRTNPVAEARLWVGLDAGLRTSEHRNVLPAVKARHPKGFTPPLKSGHKSWFYRPTAPRRVGVGARGKPHARGALPIKEHTIDISPGARELTERTARRMMQTVYPETFRKDYKRRIDKIRTRNRQ